MRVSQKAFSFSKGSCLLLLGQKKQNKTKQNKTKTKTSMEIHRAQIFFNSYRPLKYVISARLIPHAFQLQFLQELVIRDKILDH